MNRLRIDGERVKQNFPIYKKMTDVCVEIKKVRPMTIAGVGCFKLSHVC